MFTMSAFICDWLVCLNQRIPQFICSSALQRIGDPTDILISKFFKKSAWHMGIFKAKWPQNLAFRHVRKLIPQLSYMAEEPNESIELCQLLWTSMASRNKRSTNPFRMSWRGGTSDLGLNQMSALVECLLVPVPTDSKSGIYFCVSIGLYRKDFQPSAVKY